MYLDEEKLKIANEMLKTYGDRNKIGNYKILKDKVRLTPEEDEFLRECF